MPKQWWRIECCQPAGLTRKSGIQPVKQPGGLGWASRKCGLLQCDLCTPEWPAGRQHASHLDFNKANIQPTNTQLSLPPSIPLQLHFSVSPPSFVPQAPSQLNIVPSNPISQRPAGQGLQTKHTPQTRCLYHTHIEDIKSRNSSSHNSKSAQTDKTCPLSFLHYHYTRHRATAMFQPWRRCAKIEK